MFLYKRVLRSFALTFAYPCSIVYNVLLFLYGAIKDRNETTEVTFMDHYFYLVNLVII